MGDQVAEAGLRYLPDGLGSVVPEGYKQTEVGVIPEDWETHDFGSLVNYRKGYAFKSVDYQDSGVRIIRVSDIGYSEIEDDAPIYIDDNRKEEFAAWVLETGDLIFTTVGSKPPMYDSLVGKAVMVCSNHDGSFLNQNAVRIRSKKYVEGIQSLLLNHFRTERYIDHIEIIYRGNANQASITLENLFEFRIPLSRNKKEQTAIANALSDIDELISEQEILIAKKQAIKTATMQQLLTGRTRLPQFALREDGSVQGYKQSELGEVPEDWQVMPFREVLSIRHGKDQKSVKDESGDYPIYGTGGQMGFSRKFIYDKPSVLIGRKGTINKPRYCDEPFWTVDTLFYSEISQNADARFLYYKFCMIDWMQFNEASGVPSLNASTIEKVAVSIPRKEEQMKISAVITELDTSIKKQLQRLTKTRQIKQGMMQQLLTGKTRLIKPSVKESANV